MMRKTIFIILVISNAVAFAQRPTVGIKNFRQYLASLEVTTGLQAAKIPSVVKFYTENSTRLPKNGVVTELNGPTLMTYAALGGLFCQEHARQMMQSHTSPVELDETKPGGKIADVSIAKRTEVINGYAQLFLDRNPSPKEIQNLLALAQKLGDSPNMKMAISFCTAYAASIEFIAQ